MLRVNVWSVWFKWDGFVVVLGFFVTPKTQLNYIL